MEKEPLAPMTTEEWGDEVCPQLVKDVDAHLDVFLGTNHPDREDFRRCLLISLRSRWPTLATVAHKGMIPNRGKGDFYYPERTT